MPFTLLRFLILFVTLLVKHQLIIVCSYLVHIQAAAKRVQQLHPEGIDLILNNAGTQEPITRGIET